MRAQSKTSFWYLATFITLATVFIFAGVKYIDKGEVTNTSNDKETVTPENLQLDDSENSAMKDLPLEQQYAITGIKSLDEKRYDEAIGYFAKAIEQNPKVASYYALKSQAELLAGKSPDAKSTLETGIKENPESELLNSKLDVLNSNLSPAEQETPKL